jgi:cadmium resistance protein CadD (predicted permease)
VRSLQQLLALATLIYLGTMTDNLFAFAAQLALVPRTTFLRLSIWQTAAVTTLVVAAATVGSFLTIVPLRVIGLLALAPWWLAWRAWRQRHRAAASAPPRAGVAAFVVTVALGADNLAVWIPTFRANAGWRFFGLMLVFAFWQGLFILFAYALASHPRVREHGARLSALVLPWLYALLGLIVVVECGSLKL